MDNTPQQMFKMFASGFGTRIKSISLLINYLVNTLCWIPGHASIRCCFSSSTFLTASDKHFPASLPISCSPQDWC